MAKINITPNIILASPIAMPAKKMRDVLDQKLPARRIVCHITGTLTYINAAKKGIPPLDHLEDYFDDADRPFAHYSVDPWGRIRCHAPENERPWSQGWSGLGGRRKLLANIQDGLRKVPQWWVDEHCYGETAYLRHERAFVQLFSEGTPNDRSISIEFIQWQKMHVVKKILVPDGALNYKLTVAQYLAGNMLMHDIALRHGIEWPSDLSERTYFFLGHEDCDPWGRGTAAGGWDPGALRDAPRFDWECMLFLTKLDKCNAIIPTPPLPEWAR